MLKQIKRHTEKVGEIKQEMNKRQSARAQTDASQDAKYFRTSFKTCRSSEKKLKDLAEQDKVQDEKMKSCGIPEYNEDLLKKIST